MPKMNPPSATRFAKLKEAWEDYGHSIPWSKLIDIKYHQYSTGGGYAAVAWWTDEKKQMIEYADLERVDGVWEMINDGGEEVPLEKWLKAQPDYDCNWMTI